MARPRHAVARTLPEMIAMARGRRDAAQRALDRLERKLAEQQAATRVVGEFERPREVARG